MIRHHFTVDVEEYFHVAAFTSHVTVADWDRLPTRVIDAVDRLLDLLDAREARATFFVLGWVARRHPDVVRRIARAGHEIASHGWDHRRIPDQSARAFRASVRRTKRLLEDLTGRPVVGFRAPSFSILPGYEWALDVLIAEGHWYDSSLFPVRRPGYGYPRGARDLHPLIRGSGRLVEVPPATLRRWGVTLPAGGGAYFRILPYGLVRAALLACERRGAPGTFYIHPWELDPEQPRIAVSWASRLRHYTGIPRVAARLERLLAEFRFIPIADSVAAL